MKLIINLNLIQDDFSNAHLLILLKAAGMRHSHINVQLNMIGLHFLRDPLITSRLLGFHPETAQSADD